MSYKHLLRQSTKKITEFQNNAAQNAVGNKVAGIRARKASIDAWDTLQRVSQPVSQSGKMNLRPSTRDKSASCKPSNPLDMQVGGDHYHKLKIQPITFIYVNGLDFLQGNVVKYVTRFRAKNGKQDLLKARHYLDLLIELEYGSQD